MYFVDAPDIPRVSKCLTSSASICPGWFQISAIKVLLGDLRGGLSKVNTEILKAAGVDANSTFAHRQFGDLMIAFHQHAKSTFSDAEVSSTMALHLPPTPLLPPLESDGHCLHRHSSTVLLLRYHQHTLGVWSSGKQPWVLAVRHTCTAPPVCVIQNNMLTLNMCVSQCPVTTGNCL